MQIMDKEISKEQYDRINKDNSNNPDDPKWGWGRVTRAVIQWPTREIRYYARSDLNGKDRDA